MTLSIEWLLLISFILVVAVRLVAQLVGEKSEKILNYLFFLPIVLLIAYVYNTEIESSLGVLSYEGLKLTFLFSLTAFSLISLLKGIGRDLIHNFFISLHYLFGVIAIGATDFVTLTIAIVICGILAVTQILLSQNVSLSDFSIRLFSIQIITTISLTIAFICFLMATGGTGLASISNADTTFLLISMCFIIFVFLLESGSFSFSYIMTDVGKKVGREVYSIVLMNKFLVLGTCLFLINSFLPVVIEQGVYRIIIILLCSTSVLLSIIGGLNNKCIASITSKLFSINSIMVLSIFAYSGESAVLYNAFLFFVMVTLATVVCFDRGTARPSGVIPLNGSVGELTVFSICLGSLGLFPLNSLFIKRFSLLVSTNQLELNILTVLFAVGLVVLFISSTNLITSIARTANSSESVDRPFVDKFVEWSIVMIITFGGLFA
ncbi:MAG: hypothetical protein KAG61_07750 [Bacteriovoracaceae bacterium]|nr:hypothetical protein [Bacteriovoracaceae bacterium]